MDKDRKTVPLLVYQQSQFIDKTALKTISRGFPMTICI